MNCRDWEERIALAAGGDLDPESTAETERHLAECGECRGFAQGIAESLALLRVAHEEPIAAGHYTALRAAVMGRLAQQRRPRWTWVWVPAVAAGLAMAAVFLPVRRVEKPRVYMAEVRVPEVAPAPVVPVKAPVRRAQRSHPRQQPRVAPAPQPPAEPLVIKLITDDPDVVIYWIADRKGNAQ